MKQAPCPRLVQKTTAKLYEPNNATGKNTNLPAPLFGPAGMTLPAGNFPAHFQDAPHTVRGNLIAPIDRVHRELSNRFFRVKIGAVSTMIRSREVGPQISAGRTPLAGRPP